MATPRLLGALFLLGACRPETTRPAIVPLPEAAATEIRVAPQEATRSLAEAMEAESLPARTVRVRDAYIETAWLDSATGRPTSRRPIGTGVVKVRAWADPGRPGNTLLIVETLYRPLADPSLPERELERQVPPEHPTAVKMNGILEGMLKRYGGPPKAETAPPASPGAAGPEDEAPGEE